MDDNSAFSLYRQQDRKCTHALVSCEDTRALLPSLLANHQSILLFFYAFIANKSRIPTESFLKEPISIFFSAAAAAAAALPLSPET